MYLIASDGRRYLDMTGGLGVNALGHAHPRVVAAIAAQAGRYIHLSNYFLQEPQITLAELLTGRTGFPRIFFTNSGTEAVEGAVKFARRWGSRHGKNGLVALSGAFHGRTMGALSLMDRAGYRDGFGPFLDNCTTTASDDPAALERALTASTAALIVEFIQGEGGVRPLSRTMAGMIETLRSRFGFLLIADEIQSGCGRTGRFFAFEHYGITPDIVTMAKPIGGGLPLGAILATDDAVASLGPGSHGTTFGGNPVACAAGTVVMQEVTERDLVGRAAETGSYLCAELNRLKSDFPAIVRDVRGYGLMVGMELAFPGETVVAFLRERGVLVNCTARHVLRFLPPLIVERSHIDTACTALRAALPACA